MRRFPEQAGEPLKIVTETSEMVSRLSRCHLALTSGQGFALELACIGIPQLVLVQSEAH